MATKLVRRVVPWTEAPPPGWPINRANKFGALVIDHAVPGTGSIALTPTGAPAQLLNITTSDDQLATGPYTLATELYWKNGTGTHYASVIGVFHVTSWPSLMDSVGIDWGSGTARNAEIRKNADTQGSHSSAPAAGSVLPTEIVVSSTASAATAYEGSSSSSVSRIGTAGTFTTGKRRDINAGDGTSVFATRLVLFAAALTTEELLEYRADPWQIYDPRVFMVPVSAGGSDIDIAGVVGNATAAGISGATAVSIDIAGAVANAVAAGVAGSAQVATEIAGSVGNAVAAGVAGSASVTNDINIDGVVGNAVAAGVAGDTSVGSDISISGTVGNAVAAGTAGVPGVSTTIAAAVGNATAAGVSGLAAIGVLIDGSVGNAAAAGITGTLTLDIVVAGVVANAVAAGVTGSASVETAAVSATPGYTIAAKARRLEIRK